MGNVLDEIYFGCSDLRYTGYLQIFKNKFFFKTSLALGLTVYCCIGFEALGIKSINMSLKTIRSFFFFQEAPLFLSFIHAEGNKSLGGFLCRG